MFRSPIKVEDSLTLRTTVKQGSWEGVHFGVSVSDLRTLIGLSIVKFDCLHCKSHLQEVNVIIAYCNIDSL